MRWKLVAAFPFALGIAVWQSVEYVHILGAGDAPIVEGDIIRREDYSRAGIPGGKLTIRLVGQNITVTANTNKVAMKDLPQRVRFQYTGDPDREVFIEGEEHPLWVALFLWIVSAGILLFCILPCFLKPIPHEDAEPDRFAAD